MNQRVPEQLLDQLSAFLDDELAEDQSELLIRRLGRDGELRSMAARYTVIGELIREQDGPWLGEALRGRITAALTEAPALEASGAQRPVRVSGWLRPLAGAGIAAAVALVAVITLRPGVDSQLDEPDALLAGVEPPAFEPQTYVVPNPPAQLQAAPARLTNYAVMHSEYSTMGRRTVLTGIIADDPVETLESGELDQQ